MKPVLVPAAVRAYAERMDHPHRSGSPLPWNSYSRDVLVLDTETTTDELQRLTFGSWRHNHLSGDGSLACVAEGLFYDDDLPRNDPKGFDALGKYARSHKADTAEGHGELVLQSKSAFLADVFYRVGYQSRAFIVGFNLPFDLTRLANSWGEGRLEHYGWFTLALWEAWDKNNEEIVENRFRPRLMLKNLDSKGAFIQFANATHVDPVSGDVLVDKTGRKHYSAFRGNFLDLHTLAYALTGESYSLDSACKAFAAEQGKTPVKEHGRITKEYIDYNRQDVFATCKLFERLIVEFDTHPIRMNPCKAFSPASVAKAYMRTLAVAPPFKQFADVPKEVMGIAMSAYFGGRAETHIRKTPVPVVHTDFLSMYPTVSTLMGMWNLVTAEKLEIEECTETAQLQLDQASLDAYFDPNAWKSFTWFGEVEPSDDILPIRAQYDPANSALNIAVNRVTSSQPLWYTGPDLIASALSTGRPPQLKRAIRLSPRGKQSGLKPVLFSGSLHIDPVSQDFNKTLIEQRKRIQNDSTFAPELRERIARGLKLVANSVGYGIFAEVNQGKLPKDEIAPIKVFASGGSFEATSQLPETAGEFCFPPIAALVTGGARLMLAMLERSVTDAGGTWAFCDTDSMAIVANRRGGHVPITGGLVKATKKRRGIKALSWTQVDAIVSRFANLNPYDRSVIPASILEIKDVNFNKDGKQTPLFVYSIAAKRYTFFRKLRGKRLEIIQPSQHGLGHLLNPIPGKPYKYWVELVWEHIVAKALSLPRPELNFLALPALTRISVSSPHVQRPFTRAQQDLSPKERIRPSNFLLSASVAPNGHPVGADPLRFHLVAPYGSDINESVTRKWIDIHTGHDYDVTTELHAPPYSARIRSFRDVISEYASHPEPKSAGANGKSCRRSTRGLLQRRHVGLESLVCIGKETNQLEAVEQGLIHDWNEVYSIFRNPALDPWRTEIIPRLKKIPARELATAAQVSERTIRSIRNEHSIPSTKTRTLLLKALTITEESRR